MTKLSLFSKVSKRKSVLFYLPNTFFFQFLKVVNKDFLEFVQESENHHCVGISSTHSQD